MNSYNKSQSDLCHSLHPSFCCMSTAVRPTQLSEMMRRDRSFLLSLLHSESGDSRSVSVLRHELLKTAESNQSLLLANTRLRQRLQFPCRSN